MPRRARKQSIRTAQNDQEEGLHLQNETSTLTMKQLAEADGGPIDIHNSIFSYVEKCLVENSNEMAIVAMHQPAKHLSELVADDTVTHGCLQWTYSQVHAAALRFAFALIAKGVEPGMKVVTLFPNRVEGPLTLWMTALLRLTFCPLDNGALTRPRRGELVRFIKTLAPEVIIVANMEGANAVEQALASCLDAIAGPKVKIVLDCNDMTPIIDGWTSLSALPSRIAPSPTEVGNLLNAARQEDPDRIAIILFTSGTSSGNPKGCPRHVASICHGLACRSHSKNLTAMKRVLQYTANFRAISNFLALQIWSAGGAIVLPDPAAGARDMINAIRDHRISFLLLVPGLLHELTTSPEFQHTDVRSVIEVQLGADIVVRSLLEKAQAAFPHASVSNSHGMTEASRVFRWPYQRYPLGQIRYVNNICPVGKPLPGVQIHIVHPETRRLLPRGEHGELVLSCESVIKSYVHNAYAAAFFLDEHGRQWFRTGDLAFMDDEGVTYILGRITDRIKRAGIPIMPIALETSIQDFVGGAKTCVLGMLHPTLGQEPFAVLERACRTEKDVKGHVLQTFGKDYALGGVASLGEIGLEKWPVNATGKIMKGELSEAVRQYAERPRARL